MPDNNIHQIDIPAEFNIEEIVRRLMNEKTTPRQKETLEKLAETVRQTARPVGIYRVAKVQSNNGKKVEIDGVTFTSRLLGKLLEGRDTAVPFIATGGKELDELPVERGEMMKQFYLDMLKTMVVANAVRYLKEQVQKTYNIPQAALVNPGEVEDWHLDEQRPLFSLFDEVEKRIGVTLTGGGVMKPIKSRSGIIFPNESGFESCQLCPNLKCPGRRCKYEPEKVKYYLG